MVKIPQFIQKERITTQAQAPKLRGSDISTTGQALQQAGALAGKIGLQFEHLRKVDELTAAETKTSQFLTDLKLRSRDDKNVYTLTERSQEEMNAFRSEIVEGLSDEDTKAQFEKSFTLKSNSDLLNIDKIARIGQLKQGQQRLSEGLAATQQDILNASNPMDTVRGLDKAESMIKNFIGAGVIDPEAGGEMLEEFMEDTRKAKPQHDFEQMTKIGGIEGTKQFRDKVLAGEYDLSPQEEQTIISAADTRIERDEKIAKRDTDRRQLKGYEAAQIKLINNELDRSEAKDLFDKGEISITQFNSLQKGLNSNKNLSPLIDFVTQSELESAAIDIIVDMAEDFNEDEIIQRTNDLYAQIIEQNRGGNIPSEIKKTIQLLATSISDKITATAEADVETQARIERTSSIPGFLGLFKAIVNKLPINVDQEAVGQKRAEISTRMYGKLLDGVNRGDDLKGLASKIVIEEQEKANPRLKEHEDGETITRGGRTFKVVKVDGKNTYKEVK